MDSEVYLNIYIEGVISHPGLVVYNENITLANNVRIFASYGSIVKFNGDAIVNAANKGGIKGGGVDGAINRAGGKELIKARQAFKIESGTKIRIPIGTAKVTSGTFGDLKVKHIIHATGPNLSKGDLIEDLSSAYKAAYNIAVSKNCKSIAFTLISAGVFRGTHSKYEIIKIGIETIIKSVLENETELEYIYFVAFDPEEYTILTSVIDQIKNP